jgi:hypothetical protein
VQLWFVVASVISILIYFLRTRSLGYPLGALRLVQLTSYNLYPPLFLAGTNLLSCTGCHHVLLEKKKERRESFSPKSRGEASENSKPSYLFFHIASVFILICLFVFYDWKLNAFFFFSFWINDGNGFCLLCSIYLHMDFNMYFHIIFPPSLVP